MPSNALNEFTLSTLSDAELRAIADELGLSFEMMRELRLIEWCGAVRRFRDEIDDASADMIERQRGGIQCH